MIMTYDNFKKIIELEIELINRNGSLSKLGIDVIDYNDKFWEYIKILKESILTKEGIEHFDGYIESMLFKDKDKNYSPKNPMCWDANTKKPLYWDLTSLWTYLIENNYFKNLK